MKTKVAAFSFAFAVMAPDVTGSVVARNLFTAISDSSTSSTCTETVFSKPRARP